MSATRQERDSMGTIAVPASAYWGAQTARALAQAPISGRRMPEALIRALGRVKALAAEVNLELELLDSQRGEAIVTAAREVAAGRWSEHFPLDIFQTGSGTSTNMNANEVIANRANELLGQPLGTRDPVHPNDHVNRGQSSNDVIPTAIHIAVRGEIERLHATLGGLHGSLLAKSEAFADVLKPGRTHLQDAVPIALGQEFEGYAAQILHARRRLRAAAAEVEELALGGTALGTGLGTHPEFAARVIARLSREAGIAYRPAESRFEALAARDALVAVMGALNTIAVSAMKIAHDLRFLSSGPRAGLAEITLPALQPGSSIMPGKVNPVVPEIVVQAAAQVMGHHTAVTVGGPSGPLDLNIMMPMMAANVLDSLQLLERSLHFLDERCVRGIEANREACERLVAWSLAMATPLAPKLGYDRAAEIAKQALERGQTVREVVIGEGLLTEAEADALLDPRKLLGPR